MNTILTLREKVIIFTLLILMGLGAYKFYSYKKYMDKQYGIAANIANDITPKLKQVEDENGRLHGVVDVIDVDRKAYMASNKVFIDSIAKLTHSKPKNIKSVSTIGTKTVGHIVIKPELPNVPESIDTQIVNGKQEITKRYPVNFTDSFLTLNGTASLFSEKLSISANYTIVDSILIVNKMVKTGFLGLGKAKMQMDISSTNKHTTVTYAKTINLTDVDRRKWTVGAGIFYGFDGAKFKPFLGIGISRTIFRF